jgi:hypothetical protein
MKVSIKCLAAMMLALWSLGASAQPNDAAYCKALVEKYETYIGTMSTSRTPESADGRIAINDCKMGNSAKGIPVLEQKLRNARIDLPPRS